MTLMEPVQQKITNRKFEVVLKKNSLIGKKKSERAMEHEIGNTLGNTYYTCLCCKYIPN